MVQCNEHQWMRETHTARVLQKQPQAWICDTLQGYHDSCALPKHHTRNTPPHTSTRRHWWPSSPGSLPAAGLVRLDLAGEPLEMKGRGPRAVGLLETETLPQCRRLMGTTHDHLEDSLRLRLWGLHTSLQCAWPGTSALPAWSLPSGGSAAFCRAGKRFCSVEA